MKLLLTLVAFLMLPLFLSAQVDENFEDADYLSNPVWTGTPGSWIVNSNQQLQSSNTTANGTFYIATPNTLAKAAQWEFSVTLNFNTSSVNYVDVYLTASDSMLSNNTTSGYFVRIGNTDDEISLYRKDATGNIRKLIDGANGVTNTSSSKLRIRVVREESKEFHLFYSTANNTTFTSAGSVMDSVYSTSACFGFLVRQSTSSFFQKHFFDDILVQPYAPDTIPPYILSLLGTSINTLDVLFSEALDITSARSGDNYVVNDVGAPSSVQIDASNAALVHLSFTNSFKNGTRHTLTVSMLRDIEGNTLAIDTASFSVYTPQRFDAIIDEIMADPSPSVGLPNAEYIELKNTSGRQLDLQGWRLSTSSSTSAAFPAYVFPADSFLIVTSATNAPLMSVYGKTLAVGSFPALDNDGTELSLRSKEEAIIHSVSYRSNWYQNDIKSNGGWSLEMIDTHYPCSGQNNWKACTHQSGGTPGKSNAVDAVNRDEEAPALQSYFLADKSTIILTFNEPLDTAGAINKNNFSITPSVGLISVSVVGSDFTQVQLNLSAPLDSSTVYTLSCSGLKDCIGNELGSEYKVSIGLPQTALSNDLVINEILFNPKSNASDYIELYNRSNKILDAAQLYIANRNSTGAISSSKKLSDKSLYILPGDYIVVTEDAYSLQQSYFVKDPGAVLALSSLPSYPDDKGTVVLLNAEGDVLNEVAYTKDWHFALITEDEGVALERIDPDVAAQDKDNWHSAASTVGYGTPTYKNSHYKQAEQVNAVLDVTPKVFSPDNDGYEDQATIRYQLSESGYVANILIFDAAGRLVRSLVKNSILGLNGSWNWDGLDEKKQRLPIGPYIIYTEIFNLQGKKKQLKNVVVLAGKRS